MGKALGEKHFLWILEAADMLLFCIVSSTVDFSHINIALMHLWLFFSFRGVRELTWAFIDYHSYLKHGEGATRMLSRS